MKRVYVKHCKYLFLGLFVMMIGSLAACGQKKTESEPEPEPESKTTNASEFPVNSILYFNDDEG